MTKAKPFSRKSWLKEDYITSFGLQYRFAGPDHPVVSNQRLPAEPTTSKEKACIICTDTKPIAAFPRLAVTATCTHSPTTCLECVATSISSDLRTKLWNDIRCPECREPLRYDDVQRYADPETRER